MIFVVEKMVYFTIHMLDFDFDKILLLHDFDLFRIDIEDPLKEDNIAVVGIVVDIVGFVSLAEDIVESVVGNMNS